MGIKYLWDTNTAVYYLQQQFPAKAEKLIDEIMVEEQPAISVITEIEMLCWNTNNQNDLDALKNFIADAWVIELHQQLKLKTAEIRKLHKIKLPDAIIAATAIVSSMTLITRNTKDFSNIEGLKILNVWETK